MKIINVIVALLLLAIAGCGGRAEPLVSDEPEMEITADSTVGALTEVFAHGAIQVEGYGLVGGLKETGSSECPSNVRYYLKQYIMQKLPGSKMDVDKLIDDKNTAVVYIEGAIPATASKKQTFDLKVSAIQGSQTSSLKDGWMYNAILKEKGTFGMTTRTLANAEGSVYIDAIDTITKNEKQGYILAGGMVLDDYHVYLALRRPSYKAANLIRNKLNERFGDDTAKAVSDGKIVLQIPEKYREQKQRFISIIKAIYLVEDKENDERRIEIFTEKLATEKDKQSSEIVLEAIGNKSFVKLSALLNSANEEVRFRAARCMLNLGSDTGLNVLRQIAIDKNSMYQIEALEAITLSAGRNDAAAISRKLLKDDNFDVQLAAYEQLRKLNDIAISQKFIGRNFYLEKITQSEQKTIFASRSGEPKIVLFGAPIYCKEDIFIQSEDKTITLNAPAGQDYVSIIFKHTKQADIAPIQLRSSFAVDDIISKLGDEPINKTGQKQVGLNISYSNMICLLKEMCDKGAIDAEFKVGKLPQIMPIVK